MRVALGLKAHSGWAAMVCIGAARQHVDQSVQIIERRRIELIEDGELWAKMPYHSAEKLPSDEARDLVKRGIESAHRVALRQMRGIVSRLRERKDDVVACAVIVPGPMPDWSTEEILAVHFRMHKAEGVLFPAALCRAAEACDVKVVTVPAKQIDEVSVGVSDTLTALGKTYGTPWAKDQKVATVAAMMALKI